MIEYRESKSGKKKKDDIDNSQVPDNPNPIERSKVSIHSIEKLFEGDLHLVLSSYEREVTEMSKEFKCRSRRENYDIARMVICKNPEYIEITQSSWVLIILISESIFNIIEMIISVEIIVKKSASSSYNSFLSLISIDPEFGLANRSCFCRTYCYPCGRIIYESIEKEIIRKDEHTPRLKS